MEGVIRERFLRGEAQREDTQRQVMREVLRSLQNVERAILRVEESLAKQAYVDSTRTCGTCDTMDTTPQLRSNIGIAAAMIEGHSESMGARGSADLAVDANISTTSSSVVVESSKILRRHKGVLTPNKAAISESSRKTWWHCSGTNGGDAMLLDNGFAGQLGTSWPSSVRLRDGLQGESTKDIIEQLSTAPCMSTKVLHADGRRHRGLPLDPDSWFVFIVDWVRFVALLYEIFMTPIMLAWALEPDGWLEGVAWILACYWVVDCVLNFCTGFYLDSDLVMDWFGISKHYLKTWFGLDFLLLGIDWVILLLDSALKGQASKQLTAVLTTTRALRCVKILRLGKVVVVLNAIASNLLSKENAMKAQLLKIPFALLIYNHLVCCAWALVGRWERQETSVSWLQGAQLSDDTVLTEYLASLHWTFAQMTPGPININSKTNLERAMNCALLVCGLLYGSIIISQFSGHIMQMTVLQRGKVQKMDTVRLFLRQKEVSSKLAVKIQKQVRQRIFEDCPIQFSQVQAFEQLAAPLRQELLKELRLPKLLSHPLFRIWYGMDAVGVIGVSQGAMDAVYLHTQDLLFAPGEASHQMYIVSSCNGHLKYIQRPGFALVAQETVTKVKYGCWFCEAALWSYWTHVGAMEAVHGTELLVLDADGLMKELRRNTPGSMMVRHYGRGFHMRVTTALPPLADLPTDISVPYTDLNNLISTGVGIGLLESALEHNQITMSEETKEDLITELVDQRCSLNATSHGTLERIVCLVALQLTNGQEEILLQFGRIARDKGWKTLLSFPGVKRGANELHESALQHLIAQRLPNLNLIIDNTYIEHEHNESMQFGVPTLYQRTITCAYVDGDPVDDEWAMIPVSPESVGARFLGVKALYRVGDELEGHHVYGWVKPAKLKEMQDSRFVREQVELWLEQLNLAAGVQNSPSEVSFDDVEV